MSGTTSTLASYNGRGPPVAEQDRYLARLDKVRGTAVSWIGSADVKATGLLIVASVVLNALAFFPLSSTDSSLSTVTKGILLGAAILAILSVGAACMVLLPTLNRAKILKRGAAGNAPDRSLTYFSDLAELSLPVFKKTIAEATIDNEMRDVEEQTYILAVIANRKMMWMRASVVLLLACLLVIAFLGVTILLGVNER
jgi:hypothetical protein